MVRKETLATSDLLDLKGPLEKPVQLGRKVRLDLKVQSDQKEILAILDHKAHRALRVM